MILERAAWRVGSAALGLCVVATAGGVTGGASRGETEAAGDLSVAEPYLPGVVSTGAIEDAGTFSPDGKVFVFARREGQWGGASGPGILYQVARVEAGWAQPERLPFSGRRDDGDPFFAPDGRRLFFTSAPVVSGGAPADADIWVVERQDDGWGQPRPILEVNSPGTEYSPVVTANGDLYFASTRAGGFGQGDLYVARRQGSSFGAPENLGPAVNSPQGEWNLFIPADGSFLLFEASERAANRSPSGDLYVSYPESGGWGAPVPLSVLNTPESELNARLSPDGEHLYFARSLRSPDGGHFASLHRVEAASVLPHLAAPGRAGVVVIARSGHEAWIVEAGSWRALRRVEVGRGAHEVAVSPDGRFAYTADYGVYPEPHGSSAAAGGVTWIEESSGTISEIDLISLERRRVIEVPGCRRNHGILVSSDGSRLWTTCEEEGLVLEIESSGGTVVRDWKTAPGSHTLVATADDSVVVTASTDDGSVSLIRRREGRVDTVSTGRGAEGLALSPDGSTVWVSNAQDGTLSVVDLAEGRVERTFPSEGRFPVKVGFTPGGESVWVANTFSRSLAVFDSRTHQLRWTREFDSPPLGLLIPPTGSVALVTFPRRGELGVLDLATGELLETVPGILEADGLGWVPDLAE
jgi:DNA-binding beta-propeller fold protein YncE